MMQWIQDNFWIYMAVLLGILCCLLLVPLLAVLLVYVLRRKDREEGS